MYVVVILEAAHEDLRNIVAYICNENPSAEETLGHELLDEAMSLESSPYRGFRVRKRGGLFKTHPWELSNLLPDQGTETGCRNRSFQAWSTSQNKLCSRATRTQLVKTRRGGEGSTF